MSIRAYVYYTHTSFVTTVFPASSETIENVLSDRKKVCDSVTKGFSGEQVWSAPWKGTTGGRFSAQKDIKDRGKEEGK